MLQLLNVIDQALNPGLPCWHQYKHLADDECSGHVGLAVARSIKTFYNVL